MTTIGFKLIYTGDKNGNPQVGDGIYRWVHAQQGFDKFAIEKMDSVLPFLNSGKDNDALAKERYDPQHCKDLKKQENA